jgi:hypothetical protein
MGAEAKAAKWLVDNGYTPEQVVGCYRFIARDAFWAGKHISLMTVTKQIGAWKASQPKPRAPEPAPAPEPERPRATRADWERVARDVEREGREIPAFLKRYLADGAAAQTA